MWKPVLFLFAALPVFAQWPDFPGKGVPMKNGKPDLEAPAPKTSWGKTDFSGLWENIRPALKGDPPTAAFANIGANLPGGLPFKPLAAELVKERVADHSKNNPDARCLPMGIMQYNTHSQPRKIIQTPELLVIIYEPNAGLRQIFLDGRKAPPAEVEPWWFGYSVGHWEGDELVVETTHMRDVGWLDIQGSPITSNGKITERFRRTSYGRLDVIATIEDSDVYTVPFTVAMRQRIMPGAELIEFVCGENDRFTSYLDQAEKAAPGTK